MTVGKLFFPSLHAPDETSFVNEKMTVLIKTR
jgi:hypothetical protein